eukprot:CAMPEP_0119157608 /NCGR_PEP_ID=MMETSP1310-20130426/52841_1 /TAXON_ID=464262 /ORGANISM="Genus nov. species nov., Strain RCC2339" /LENGTH=415 /DNA_ID=CAMNT_0007150227 /DNA_START=104 /DNA_END=1351 /DNA_ORIENTATION=+
MDAMRIVIDDPEVEPALEQVRNGELVWAIIGQVPKRHNPLGNKYKLVDKGEDWDDFLDSLDESKVHFCLVRETVKEVPRFAFITWCGEGVPGAIKGKYGYHCKDMENWIGHFHVQINARGEEDVERSILVKAMTKALGAAYECGQIEQGSGSGTKVGGSGYKKDTAFQTIQEKSADYWNSENSQSAPKEEKKTATDYKNIQGASSLKGRFEDLAKPEPAPEIHRTGKVPDFSYKEPEPEPEPYRAPPQQHSAPPPSQPEPTPEPAYEPPAAAYEPEPTPPPAEEAYPEEEAYEEEAAEEAYEEEAYEEEAYEEEAAAEEAYEEEAYEEEAYEEEAYEEEAYEEEAYEEEAYEEASEEGGQTCTALYAYAGDNEGDLAFAENDVITILDQSDPSGWWKGSLNGVEGFFPSNFVSLN